MRHKIPPPPREMRAYPLPGSWHDVALYCGGQSHCSMPIAGRRGEAEAAGLATSNVMPSRRALVDSEVSLDLRRELNITILYSEAQNCL